MTTETRRSAPGAVRLRCEPVRRGKVTDERRSELVTCGVPWPPGVLQSVDALRLIDGSGRETALQARSLEHWPDGSVRWALLDWLATTERETAEYRVEVAHRSPTAEPDRAMVGESPQGDLVVDTGRCCVTFGKGDQLFRAVTVDGRRVLDLSRTGFYAVDEAGTRFGFSVESVFVEDSGPVRTTVVLEGAFVRAAARLVSVVVRCCVARDSATLRLDVTITNERAAGHPGGIWSLGSEGSVFLRDMAFALVLPTLPASGASGAGTADAGTTAHARTEIDSAPRSVTLPWEIYQDSSGGENWDSPNHLDREGKVPLQFRGFQETSGGETRTGWRASPAISLTRGPDQVAVACRHFWQCFPKALSATEDRISLHLFPPQSAAVHELQGGEQKTHTFHVALASDSVTERPLAWCERPLVPQADADAYAAGRAVRYLTPRASDPNRDYLRLVDQAIEGEDTFFDKRETIDEYGWRHFGDIFGDHEAAFDTGTEPFVSHYNNQYDAARGFGIQFLRGGDRAWYEMMDDLVRHVVDIDTYHTDRDKSAYNRGQFWHTVHYIPAGTGTHRSYPPLDGVHGGGPSTGQLYTTGLLLHYYLTGSAASREAVLRFGQYVVDADDGRKTIFRLLDRSYTGHVSESGADRYHGPGRSPANAINALVDCHRLSGERRFLDKAEQLVCRTIHPNDDLAERNLLDAELRWYYTMYLEALGKYLDWKCELNELDAMYNYARTALLRYADWAAEHEVPYLDRPEVLEYPTETWAAQEMRKSDLFRLAYRYSSDENRRTVFQERARFFFDTAVDTLKSMKTRSFCRPVVLLSVCGHSQSYLDEYPDERAPEPETSTTDFGRPTRFVPQKTRVKRKLAWMMGGVFAAAAAWALSSLVR